MTTLRKRQSFVETINTAKGLRFARKALFLHLNQSMKVQSAEKISAALGKKDTKENKIQELKIKLKDAGISSVDELIKLLKD